MEILFLAPFNYGQNYVSEFFRAFEKFFYRIVKLEALKKKKVRIFQNFVILFLGSTHHSRRAEKSKKALNVHTNNNKKKAAAVFYVDHKA